MTSEQRTWLRNAIDQARRALVKREQARQNVPTCAGCGIQRDEYTPTCAACSDRHRRRQGRKSPDNRRVKCDTCDTTISVQAIRRRKFHKGLHRCYPCIRSQCVQCGTHVDNHTPGCRECTFRHSQRRREQSRKAA